MIYVVRIRVSATQREQNRLVKDLTKLGFEVKPVEGRADRLSIQTENASQIDRLADMWGVERVISVDGKVDILGRRHFLEVALPKLMLWLGILTALILISGWFSQGLGEAPEMHRLPENLKPEWYLLFLHAMASLLPDAMGFLVPLTLAGILLIFIAWPFIEINPDPNPRKRPLAVVVGLGAVGALALLTLFGWLGL